MAEISTDMLVGKMRVLAQQASQDSASANHSVQAPEKSFAKTLGEAIDQVNELQTKAGDLQTAYQLGDPNVGLVDVMVASQKSNVAFQATLQVRNRFIQAYQDIMNMPI